MDKGECFMEYDMEDLARRVEKKKKSFFKVWFVCVALVIGAIFAAAFVPERKFFVPAVIIFILCVVAVVRAAKKYNLSVLYSGEIEGTNIKEHEIMGVREGKPIRRKYATVPHNYSNYKSDFPRSKIRGSVYLRLDNGDIFEVANLNSAQLEFYRDGDRMKKPFGARYPQVISRDTEEQICPICGRINHKGAECCGGCGLLIVPRR